MAYLHDYLDYCKNLTFDELPFSEVDGVILSLLPMLDCNIAFPKKGERTFINALARHVRVHELNNLGLIIKSDIAKMLYRASRTKRFAELKIHDLSYIVDETTETQATSIVVDINEELSVVVFSGTDDTIVGWKEDFAMIYNHNIPCMKHSLDYLNRVGKDLKQFYIVGHSKGGMESIYAYCFAEKEIQDKVIEVYSYDGQGLPKPVCEEVKEECKYKIKHFVPQGGIIGRLFYSPVEPIIIYSSYRGLQQHDPMSWEINRGKLSFTLINEFNIQSNLINQKINNIISSLDEAQSKMFVHNFFEVLSAGGASTLTDITKKPHRALRKYLHLPQETKNLIGALIIYLAKDKIISRELLLGVFGINQIR